MLSAAYTFDKAKLIVREMTDNLVLDLVGKKLVTDRNLLVRRMNVVAENTVDEAKADIQLDLFDDRQEADDRERRRQEAILAIKKKYGRNAILKGMNFEEGATARDRNQQVGGHKA